MMKSIILALISVTLIALFGYSQEEQPLKLTIKSDKEVYEVEEEISIEMNIKNVSNKPVILADELTFVYLEVKDKSNGKNFIRPYFQAQVSPYILGELKPFELPPESSYTKVFNFGHWSINIQEKGEHLGALYYINEFPNRYIIKGIYNCSTDGLKRYSNSNIGKCKGILQGTLTSNTIAIEVVEKLNKSAETFSEMNGLIRDIHSNIMSIRKKYQWLNAYNKESLSIGNDGKAAISFYTKDFWEQPSETIAQQPDHLYITYLPLSASKERLKYYSDFDNVEECKFPALNSKVYAELVIRGKMNEECMETIKKIIIENCQRLHKEQFKKQPRR